MKEEVIEPTLGVKVENCTVTVEQIDDSIDVSDFNFLFTFERSELRGNESFIVNINPLSDKEELEFYGWKLKKLSFPGNWFGQIGVCVLEDKYGKQMRESVTNQFWVKEDYRKAVEKAVSGAVMFAKENPFLSYFDFFDLGGCPFLDLKRGTSFGFPTKSVGLSLSHLWPHDREITLKGLEVLIDWAAKRTKEYNEIMKRLEEEDERYEPFKEKLKSNFYNDIEKWLNYKING